MAGLAACVGHLSSSCLCSGFLFGELADDTNEGSVLVLQPLVVRLQLCQNLQRDKDEVGLQLGTAGWTSPSAQREQQGRGIPAARAVAGCLACVLLTTDVPQQRAELSLL